MGTGALGGELGPGHTRQHPYPEEDSVAEVEKSPEEEDKGTIATVAKKAAKGAAKGAVKGAANETTE